MSSTYFVAEDAYGDLYVWREEEGLEHRPEPLVRKPHNPYLPFALDDYLWNRLTEGMERR